VDDVAIIEKLRTVRNADDALSELRSRSLEARRDRIAEALADPEWAAGPAELLYTYPSHAVAKKDGMVMRVAVEEKDGKIELGKIEVHEIGESVHDVGQEVIETARVAVQHILDEQFEDAAPMVASVANALSYKGDLRRKVQTEIAKRSISRDAWWHNVVREHMGDRASVEIPAPRANDLSGSIDELKEALVAGARIVSSALTKLDENTAVGIKDAARDISADYKYAIQALDGINTRGVIP
jgi:hypothetical protein